MTNGHFEFEVKGVNYSLHFGNIAVEQFLTKSIENIQNGVSSNTKSLCDMVFAGMFNSALIKGENIPSYPQVIALVDLLIEDELDEIQQSIIDTYTNSRATIKQMERLNPSKGEKKKKA